MTTATMAAREPLMPPKCSSWCVADHAEEISAGDVPWHHTKPGDFRDGWFSFQKFEDGPLTASYIEAIDDTLTPDQLRECAADAMAAAQWIELQAFDLERRDDLTERWQVVQLDGRLVLRAADFLGLFLQDMEPIAQALGTAPETVALKISAADEPEPVGIR